MQGLRKLVATTTKAISGVAGPTGTAAAASGTASTTGATIPIAPAAATVAPLGDDQDNSNDFMEELLGTGEDGTASGAGAGVRESVLFANNPELALMLNNSTSPMAASEMPVLDDGMDVFLTRSREWLKAAKIFLSYTERRAAVELELGKSISRAVRAAIDTFSELEFRSEGSYAISTMSLLKQQEAFALRQQEFGNALTSEVVAPLTIKRDQHEKSRKRLQAQLAKEQKKHEEQVAMLLKAKLKYHAAVQTWEKALEDKKTEENSSYKVRLDKRVKEEDDAKTKMAAAEDAYRAQLKVTNNSQETFKRYLQLLLSAYERLLVESDVTYKECLLKYLQIQQNYMDDLPGMTKALTAQVITVDNKADFHKFVTQLSKNEIYNPRPFIFEKNTGSVSDQLSRASVTMSSMDEPASSAVADSAAAHHKSQLHKFTKQFAPALCLHCHQMSFRGISCEVCGITCHKNCVEKLKLACEKSNNQPDELVIFGVPLDEQPHADSNLIPFIIEVCVHEVEARGMDSEGIYRIAGIKSSVEKLGALFERNGRSKNNVDLSVEPDINAITGCLKAFLRQLPEPVIPYDLYQDIISAAGMETLDLDGLIQTLIKLPPINYDTLLFLMHHLSRVSERAAENKMRPSNLAIVFGPSLLHNGQPQDDQGKAFMENGRQCAVVERIIQNIHEIEEKATPLRKRAWTGKETVKLDDAPLTPKGSAKPTAPVPSPAQLSRQRSSSARHLAVYEDDEDDELDEKEIERLARAIEQNLSKEKAEQQRGVVVEESSGVSTAPPSEFLLGHSRNSSSESRQPYRGQMITPEHEDENVTVVASEIRSGVSIEALVRTLSSAHTSPREYAIAHSFSDAPNDDTARPLPSASVPASDDSIEIAASTSSSVPRQELEQIDNQHLDQPKQETQIKRSLPVPPAATSFDEHPLPIEPADIVLDLPQQQQQDAPQTVSVSPPPEAVLQNVPITTNNNVVDSSSNTSGSAVSADIPAHTVLVPVTSTPLVNLTALVSSKKATAGQTAVTSGSTALASSTPAATATPLLPPKEDADDEEDLMLKVRMSLNKHKHVTAAPTTGSKDLPSVPTPMTTAPKAVPSTPSTDAPPEPVKTKSSKRSTKGSISMPSDPVPMGAEGTVHKTRPKGGSAEGNPPSAVSEPSDEGGSSSTGVTSTKKSTSRRTSGARAKEHEAWLKGRKEAKKRDSATTVTADSAADGNGDDDPVGAASEPATLSTSP